MGRSNEQGFTLIELVIAAFVILVLLIVSVILLRPLDFSSVRANAQRRTDIAAIGQAINRYLADNGDLPDLSTSVKAISSGNGHYNLCSYLVPKYIKDIPLDPVLSVKTTKNNMPTTDACNKPDVTYASGYGIAKDKGGRVVITAPLADGGPLRLTLPQAK